MTRFYLAKSQIIKSRILPNNKINFHNLNKINFLQI